MAKKKLILRVLPCSTVEKFEAAINEHLDVLARTPYLFGIDPEGGYWGVVFYYEWVQDS